VHFPCPRVIDICCPRRDVNKRRMIE
jgi:hypothetical protein